MIKKLADRLAGGQRADREPAASDAASRVVHFLAVAAERGTQDRRPGRRSTSRPRTCRRASGVKPEQVDEVLMKLLKAKIVSVHPDGFVVPDVAKLRHFLEFLQMKAQFGDIA